MTKVLITDPIDQTGIDILSQVAQVDQKIGVSDSELASIIKDYDAFIALGCVIKGKTPHFAFISKATTNAIMQLSFTYKKPIGNGIITCLTKKQALNRSNPRKKNKGGEAAKAILSVLGILKSNA